MASDPSNPTPGSKLIVKNVSETVRKHELRETFEKYGPVVEIYINVGYAYITFEDPGDASKAIDDLDGGEYAGERLKVEVYRGRGWRNSRGSFLSEITGRIITSESEKIYQAEPELVMEKQNQMIQNVSSVQNNEDDVSSIQNNEDDACQIFQDELLQSMTVEMNQEIEVKTKTFKKLGEQKVELDKQITELEKEQDSNIVEYEKRKEHDQQEEKSMDQEIQKAKFTLKKCQNDLANKERLKEKGTKRQVLDTQQTISKNNKIRQELTTLKRKRLAIVKEQSDLPKKQKVNEGLLTFISNTIEEKEKDLRCPVCFETAETPIYQCTGGHLICKLCLPSLKICPECRTKYPKTPFRNRFAEKVDEEIEKLSEERKEMLDGI